MWMYVSLQSMQTIHKTDTKGKTFKQAIDTFLRSIGDLNELFGIDSNMDASSGRTRGLPSSLWNILPWVSNLESLVNHVQYCIIVIRCYLWLKAHFLECDFKLWTSSLSWILVTKSRIWMAYALFWVSLVREIACLEYQIANLWN